MRVRLSETGDTIVEVLFAITVFSLIAVGGLSLMNQGTALAQRALEIGLVRQQIDAQADALRYLNRAYMADYGKRGVPSDTWNKIVVAHAVDQAKDFNMIADNSACHPPSSPEQPFALNLTKLNDDPVIPISNISDYDPTHDPAEEQPTFSRVRYDLPNVKAQGLWIQAVRSADPRDGKKTGYLDFHIRACWQTPGQAAPVTLGTVVRLYEPRPCLKTDSTQSDPNVAKYCEDL